MINVADIFISYRRECGDRAFRIKEELERRGYEVFLDVTNLSSGNYLKMLLDEIKKCNFFLLLVTEDGFHECRYKEDVYRQEIECAYANHKVIIPIMDEGYVFPERMPPSIDFLRYRQGIQYHPELLETTVSELQNKMLANTPASDSIRKNRSLRPDNKYADNTIEEMATIACEDARKCRYVYQIALDAYNNDADAFLKLGKEYHSGENIKRNHKRAVYWFYQAVLLQNSCAMYYLGECYQRGQGIKDSSAMALYWYEQGAAQKNPSTQAICALGDFYCYGEGANADILRAADLYLKAARKEDIRTANSIEDVRGILTYMQLLQKSSPSNRHLLEQKGYTLDQISTAKKEKAISLKKKDRRKKYARWCRFFGLLMGTVTALSVFGGGTEGIKIWDYPYLSSLIFWMLLPIVLLSLHTTCRKEKISFIDDCKMFIKTFLISTLISIVGLSIIYILGEMIGKYVVIGLLLIVLCAVLLAIAGAACFPEIAAVVFLIFRNTSKRK